MQPSSLIQMGTSLAAPPNTEFDVWHSALENPIILEERGGGGRIYKITSIYKFNFQEFI